jgi:hypothetical protein
MLSAKRWFTRQQASKCQDQNMISTNAEFRGTVYSFLRMEIVISSPKGASLIKSKRLSGGKSGGAACSQSPADEPNLLELHNSTSPG